MRPNRVNTFSTDFYHRVMPRSVTIPEFLHNALLWRGFVTRLRSKYHLYIDKSHTQNLQILETKPYSKRHDEVMYPENLWWHIRKGHRCDSPEASECSDLLEEIAQRNFFLPYYHSGFTGAEDHISEEYRSSNRRLISDEERGYDKKRDFLYSLSKHVTVFQEETGFYMINLHVVIRNEYDRITAEENAKGNSATYWKIFNQSYESCAHVPVECLESGIALLIGAFPYLGIRTSQSCDGHFQKYPQIDFYGYSNAGFAIEIMSKIIAGHGLQIELSTEKIDMEEARTQLRYGHWSVPIIFRRTGCPTPTKGDYEELFIDLQTLARIMLQDKTWRTALRLKKKLYRAKDHERQEWLSLALGAESDKKFM